ncbi:MAG: AI-2E family transporter [Candidatus Nanohaloarchaea archaeon]
MEAEKTFLAVLVAVLSAATWLMVKPFLAYVLFAVLLAFILYPLQKRIEPVTGARVSAFLLMLFAVAAAVLPLSIATAAVIQDAQDFTQDLNQTDVINTTQVEQIIKDRTGRSIDVETTIDNAVREFTSATFGSFSEFVNLLTSLAIGMTLMLFLLYYFLKDGDEMVAWIKQIIPMPEPVKEGLYRRTDKTTWAVIKGHVLVAVAQGLIAGLGLFIAGVPNYVFWTFMMVVLGFIPLVGSFMVWGPASVYLFLVDRHAAGIFLLVYGVIVVGLTDNVLRPIVVDRSAELHPAVIMIGVIGGVYIFGAPGLFFGPILLGVFKSVILVVKNNYENSKKG